MTPQDKITKIGMDTIFYSLSKNYEIGGLQERINELYSTISLKIKIMKREIKFRGKNKYHDHDWLFGSYVNYKKNNVAEHCILSNGTEMLSVIPETIGQFTGLTDKNGTEIYEGDILFVKFLDSEVALVVYFDEKHLCWSTRDKDDNSVKTPLYNLISNNFEMFVIRNIHDL